MLVTTRRAANSAACTLLAFAFLSSPSIASDTTPDTITAFAASSGDSTLAGHVVYLDFWASWCIPCRESFPWMNTLQEKYRAAGLRVVTVNLDKKTAAGRKFMKDMKAHFPAMFDSTGVVAKHYSLQVMPTSFLYGRDGKLRHREEGFHMDDHAIALENMIDTLLKEKITK